METGRTVRALTTAVGRGDADALAELYGDHVDLMLQETHRLTRRDEDFCLDVVHDAMLKAIRSIPVLEHEAQLRTWLRTLVRSCAIDRLRRDLRRQRREQARSAVGPDAADAGDLEASVAWLRKVLQELDPEQAQLLAHRFQLGWTLERIGRRLGLTPGGVQRRINRILATLRRRSMEPLNDG